MRDALFQPASPTGEAPRRQVTVEEEPCVAVDVAQTRDLAAVPFFDNAGRKKILIRGGTVVNHDGTQVRGE